jgi:hypothetical protein
MGLAVAIKLRDMARGRDVNGAASLTIDGTLTTTSTLRNYKREDGPPARLMARQPRSRKHGRVHEGYHQLVANA